MFFDCTVALWGAARKAMSGDARGREGLLPDQQELRQWPPRAGSQLLPGQPHGGQYTLAYHK